MSNKSLQGFNVTVADNKMSVAITLDALNCIEIFDEFGDRVFNLSYDSTINKFITSNFQTANKEKIPISVIGHNDFSSVTRINLAEIWDEFNGDSSKSKTAKIIHFSKYLLNSIEEDLGLETRLIYAAIIRSTKYNHNIDNYFRFKDWCTNISESVSSRQGKKKITEDVIRTSMEKMKAYGLLLYHTKYLDLLETQETIYFEVIGWDLLRDKVSGFSNS